MDWNSINPFPTGVLKVIAGNNVSVTGTLQNPIITNTGVASLTAGSNITLSGSTGNVTITASSGGGGGGTNPHVFVDNFTGNVSSYSTAVNTTYSFLTQPHVYSTTFQLPLSGLSNGHWIEIIPLYSTYNQYAGYSNSPAGFNINYNGVNSVVFDKTSVPITERVYMVYRDGYWNYQWNGTTQQLQSQSNAST